jgi:hypothetical protein
MEEGCHRRGICHFRSTLRVWAEFIVPIGKRSEHLRGMPLVTCMKELQSIAWEPMASTSVNLFTNTSTYLLLLPGVFEVSMRAVQRHAPLVSSFSRSLSD